VAVGFDTTKPSARVKFRKPTLLPQAIGHHTPAVRTLFGLATSAGRSLRSGTRRKKRKASLSSGVRRRRKTSGSSQSRSRSVRSGNRGRRRAHLVKGSAAAKKHMAKIRRKRK